MKKKNSNNYGKYRTAKQRDYACFSLFLSLVFRVLLRIILLMYQ